MSVVIASAKGAQAAAAGGSGLMSGFWGNVARGCDPGAGMAGERSELWFEKM